MHTARIPPVDPAPAAITAALAMHAGHTFPSSELLSRPRLSGAAALPLAAAYARASVPSHSLRFCTPPAPDQTTDAEMQRSSRRPIPSADIEDSLSLDWT